MPDWLAVTVQLPASVPVSWRPLKVHGPLAARLTGRPDVLLAVSVLVAPTAMELAPPVNVSVWLA